MSNSRFNNRLNHQFRPVKITTGYTKYAEGSVLIEFGETKVLCTASISNKVPPFIREQKLSHGWLTAEYAMLPRATQTRTNRDGRKGSVSGRTMEIQRLIGRTLRTCVDLEKMPEVCVNIDCDVIQADGGTRTTAINGSCIALYLACQYLVDNKLVDQNPFKNFIGAISVGIKDGQVLCDLDYAEDSNIGADCNLVLSETGQVIEYQMSSEKETFSKELADEVFTTGQNAILEIINLQKESLKLI